ncbi:hypothetical protein J3Q64DRAFT_1759293 [Phycomyces blakesleeanus]|uniref:Uncharacterized protein n=2 Tax=Phycomyces blakesleeanus TaxID=4837 RepID=A0A167KF17_PHYB8|nr:hypothetical protein PHYBLDRAFT_173858 [Phycomyces blakesleeanus NRRL 1555(-)]OAD67945.1 hypothetical protein PHYBLDRAFT_173858 [Phycomyces blakesleeanus NRRL 1555(-)]|eukprot:XP_018285985.1 hypothetical protein PHYBLDRAFT_173858 [Phycomyces blakesleeanus NRRL 1555(-)]
MSYSSLLKVFSAAALLPLCFSAPESTHWLMGDPQDHPGRWMNKVHDIPTWVIPIENYDENTFIAGNVFSGMLVGFSAFYAFYHVYRVYLPSAPQGKRNIGNLNKDILGYLSSSFLASFMYSVLSLGKIWCGFGVLHNLYEAALLLHIVTQQRSTSSRVTYGILFAYILIVVATSLVLPWPFDGVFFKYQGLVVDYVLSVNMVRLYLHNKSIAAKVNVLTPAPTENGTAESGTVEDSNTFKGKQSVTFMRPVHENLFLLAFAAVVHTAGNTMIIFANTATLWLVFQFSYAVAFPIYSYYVSEEPDSSRINWYPIKLLKEVIIGVVSFVVVGVLMAIGFISSGVEL